ncbi:phospholipid carrier-dependent glycosyltransferase [Oscillatoria laete-virens NRMC-F 0139]|nr:phospholipid carrier-dependent glycosyltransferase [Oscillatoria laete-virens NRMC-F 0139]
MTSQEQMFRDSPKQKRHWFWWGMGAILVLSLILRFWGLSRFNQLVFDEVYFAKFANNYLTRTPFFDAHPPLAKYLIAIGMGINSMFPFGDQSVTNELTGSVRSTFSYRWLNALTGALIPLVVSGIAYQLTRRYTCAFFAALFIALDGLFLVESRYALVNVYLVIFGLFGSWFLLLGLSRIGRWRVGFLILAGINFGASAAVKWNGLGFLLGAYLLWAIAWVLLKLPQLKPTASEERIEGWQSPLDNLAQIPLWHLLGYLGVVPLVTYGLSFIPHIQQNPEFGFWELQRQILSYHRGIGNTPEVHPYCSSWYSWPLMWRPVAYYYEQAQTPGGNVVVYDVHAMGNPVLWWLSAAAIALLALTLIIKRFKPTTIRWTALFLVVNYAANWLPWAMVTRCAFIYHYMGASVFAFMGLALLVDRWFRSPQPQSRWIALATVGIVALAFIFWLPVYLGLPLSPLGFRMRIFLPSWV